MNDSKEKYKIGDIVGSSDPQNTDVYLITQIIYVDGRKYFSGFDQYGGTFTNSEVLFGEVLDHVDIDRTFKVMRECKSKN